MNSNAPSTSDKTANWLAGQRITTSCKAHQNVGEPRNENPAFAWPLRGGPPPVLARPDTVATGLRTCAVAFLRAQALQFLSCEQLRHNLRWSEQSITHGRK